MKLSSLFKDIRLLLSQKKRQKQISIAVFVFIVLWTFWFLSNSRVIATAGDYQTTVKDRKYRTQVSRLFYPNTSSSDALDQLVRASTYAQILKNNGEEISELAVRQEEMRVVLNSKDPESLRKIRLIFGDDHEAYKKTFIFPLLAEKNIYHFFTTSSKPQHKSLGKVKEFLDDLKTSRRSFEEVAKSKNLKFQKLTLSKADESTKFWLDNAIPKMRVGGISSEPFDFEEQWVMVHYLKKGPKSTHIIEAAFIPKDSYSDWLTAETAKVKIK